MRDERIPPLVLHLLLGALAFYWLLAVVRCGEDECLDRPVVAGIIGAFWLAAAAVVVRARGRGGSRAALRWATALLWPVAAALFLSLLVSFAFDVVYD